MRVGLCIWIVGLVLGGILRPPLVQAAGEPPGAWYPVPVQAGSERLDYQPLPRTQRAWRLCALLPNGRDHFFWAVSWGLLQEARRSGAEIGIYDAGGYEHPQRQQEQLRQCKTLKADAYLLSVVDAQFVQEDVESLLAAGGVVVDLVNGLPASLGVQAHATDEHFEALAQRAADCLLRDAGTRQVRVAWFPGPEGLAWADGIDAGGRQVFRHQPQLQVVASERGATDMATQMTLVRKVLEHMPVDYVFGNAVAAEAAARLLAQRPQWKTKVVAAYANDEVVRLIQQHRVLCAASNSPVVQARIAVDLALRILEKQPFRRRVSPVVTLIDQDNVRSFPLERLLQPDGVGFSRRELTPLR